LRLGSIGRKLHGKLLLHQSLTQKVSEWCVIFSDKDAHRHTQDSKIWKGGYVQCGGASKKCQDNFTL
jgi:hypothetical protein